MSGEPKTHTPEPITLEQALAEVHQHEWVIHFHNDGFVEIETFSGDGLTYEEGLLPALSDALGVSVVARDEAAELRAALRTLVADLEDLMEESHIELYDGDGYLVGVSWGKLLQGGKDEYLSNWRDAKRLAGGEEQE